MKTTGNEYSTEAMQAKLGRLPSQSVSETRTRSLRSNGDRLNSTDLPAASTKRESSTRRNTVRGVKTDINYDDQKPAAKEPAARNRRGKRKNGSEVVRQQTAKEHQGDEVLINSCAFALASIDKRASARAQIVDANTLVQDLLLPMSFPWAMPTSRMLKAVPRDIEDIPGILTIDNGIPEDNIYGKLEHIKSPTLPKGTFMAARRSNDAGCIELTTRYRSSQGKRHLIFNPKRFDPREGDPQAPGELSLRMYQEVLRRKRGRHDAQATNQNVKLVSFRLGSSSSRSSIFENSGKGERGPLFLMANLPRIVQEGSKRMDKKSYEYGQQLGTYNCRKLPPQSVGFEDRERKNRFYVGRTRLVWTDKKVGSSRAPYRSILTGGGLDSVNSLKRPLRVKVAIRLNGELVSHCALSTLNTSTTTSSASSRSNSDVAYPMKIVNDALDAICCEAKSPGGANGQCSMDLDKFFSKIVAHRRNMSLPKNGPASMLQTIRGPLTLVRRSEKLDSQGPAKQLVGRARLNIQPAKLDCLTTEDGLCTVQCTQRGHITWESVTDELTRQVRLRSASILSREVALDTKRCFVCWDADRPLLDDASTTVQCADCGIRIHASCCGNASHDTTTPWICHTCSTKRTTTIKETTEEPCCRVCQHPGGAMEKDATNSSVHSVCQTWCIPVGDVAAVAPVMNTPGEQATACCDLCGKQSTLMAHCAADNCNVQFHPMCGIIISMAAQVEHGQLRRGDGKEKDAFLCSQYTLRMLHTSYYSSGKSAAGNSATLPIAFCGYHNPKRDADYYGLYPGGYFLEDALSIPCKRYQQATGGQPSDFVVMINKGTF